MARRLDNDLHLLEVGRAVTWDNWDAIKELGEELTEVSGRMSA